MLHATTGGPSGLRRSNVDELRKKRWEHNLVLKYCNPKRRDESTFPMLLDTVTEDVEEAPYEVAPWYVLSATIKEKQSLLEDLQRVF